MKIYKLFWEKSPVKNHKFYILLFALCFCNTAFGQKQQITVSMKNQPLLKLFCVVMFGLINVNILYYSFSTLYQMCNLRQSL